MSKAFTAERRARFRKLLTLAADSPFPGERAAALAAAERLAARVELTLEEAARSCREPQAAEPRNGQTHAQAASATPEWMQRAYAGYAYEAAASRARQRHREQVAEAQRREEEERLAERAWRQRSGRRSGRMMPRVDFARVLILQTALPIREIARITGLSLYDVVAMKLKLRPRRAQTTGDQTAQA